MKDEYLIGVLQLAEEEINRKIQHYYKRLDTARYRDAVKDMGQDVAVQRKYQMIYSQLNRTLAEVIISKKMLESEHFEGA